MQPNECIWCGMELLDDTTHDTIFACGTVQHPRSDCWSQSTGCKEIMRSRERIKRAVEVLEGAKRICVGLCDEDGEDVDSEHDGMIYSESTEMDRATAILRGNFPESPDNSPVTADDLADLRATVQRALQRLETATRFELVRDDDGAYMKGRGSWGNWLDVIEIEQAIEILKGVGER